MRYILQKSSEHPLHWVLTDTFNGLVCIFEEGRYNDNQKFTLLDDVEPTSLNLPALVSEMADWLRENHYELIFTSPQTIKEEARKNIGILIKEAREKKGLTLRQLSKLTGIGFNHIRRIEIGKYNVTIDTLSIICNALGIEISLN